GGRLGRVGALAGRDDRNGRAGADRLRAAARARGLRRSLAARVARPRALPGDADRDGPRPARGHRGGELARGGPGPGEDAAPSGRSGPLAARQAQLHPPQPNRWAILMETMTLARPLYTDQFGNPYRSDRPGQYRVACWQTPA